MKPCELCKSEAKVYCDSDQASLCWTCDTKVHSANFLVARHSRTLLCRLCLSPTPWTAAGETLGPSAVSICDKCVVDDDDDDDDGETELDFEDEAEDEDEDENQVVPLSYTPPPAASSSGSDDDDDDDDDESTGGLLKRKRENEDLYEDEVDCLLVKKHQNVNEANEGILYDFLPLKSEAMGHKSGVATAECKPMRTVGLDLNSSDL